jgi:hypothetical protein
MSIERADFDGISEADLTDLIQAGRPEGLTIEYKRDLYGNRHADKREALKDITSFANSAGRPSSHRHGGKEGCPDEAHRVTGC